MSALGPIRRWQLNLAFYVMAGVGVLTIAATMYLSEVMRDVVRGFTESNQFWAERMAMVTELSQAAVDMTVRSKPDGKSDAATIRVRRKQVVANFDWILERAQEGLRSPLTEAEATRVGRDIGDIIEEVNGLIAASDLALARSAAGDFEGARAATATMDRHLSRITAVTANLQRAIQTHQREALADQQRAVEEMQYVKFVFAFIVLALTFGAVFVGTRVSRLTREADDHRRRYLEATEQREKDLQLANERLEGIIAERTAALQTSESKFRTLISNIPGVSYRCADDADYTMEFISDAIEQLSGYPAGDFMNNTVRTYGSIIHPEDVDAVARSVADGLRSKRPYEIEYRVLHRDGRVRAVFERGQGVFDEQGKAVYCDGVIFDVTERRNIEAELRDSEAKFRTLLGNVPGACYRCGYDTAYTMAFISDAIEEISGYPAGDFIGNRARTYASIIHSDDAAMVARTVDEARAARTRSSIEYRIIHRDGSTRWVYERGQGIYDSDGRILHIDGAIFDITSRRTLEEQLVGQKQMATLGQVAATVSHELRNPLGAIRNSMAFVRQVTADKQLGVDKALDRVDRNIERCSSIISDLLEFTSQKELDRTATAIGGWLANLLGQHRLPEEIALEQSLDCDDDVLIDQEKFHQVVVNLVDNAAQALTDPGWEPPPGRARRIIVRTERAGPHVRLSFSDTGPGIPPHVLPRIFEPLFTTKSFGIGLGLPTVRQIVEQHGGTIDLESSIDAGTTFTVFLPRNGVAPAQAGDAGAGSAAA